MWSYKVVDAADCPVAVACKHRCSRRRITTIVPPEGKFECRPK